MKVSIPRGKFDGLTACANSCGVIAALAIDHRVTLLQAIDQARGANGQATVADLLAFTTAVTKVLSPHASAVLFDPEYSLQAISRRAPGKGVLLAYEQSGYDRHAKGRLPGVLPAWSVRRLVEAGAQAIKVLLFYNPFDDTQINTVKHAYVERIGAECAGVDVPFFLEPLVYDEALGDEKGEAFAYKKPDYVTRAMEEFSKPRYGVDILKAEFPVNPAFVAGTRSFAGRETAYSRQEALAHVRNAASAASKPFIYLSAGSSHAVFYDMLELAAEAGVCYSGMLCGRATWQDAIPAYVTGGVAALEDWLAERGRQNIQALNEVLAHGAKAWWESYGGRDHIAVIV